MRGIVGAIAALGLGVASSASATVVMADGSGRVEVLAEGQSRGVGILPGEPLGDGTLSVGHDGQASFKTGDGATLEIASDSKAKLKSGGATQLELEKGAVTVEGGSQPVKLEAPNGLVATGTGAHFELALADDGTITVSSEKGMVKLQLDGASTELASGKSLSLAKGEALPASKTEAKAPAEKPVEKPAPTPVAEKPVEKPAPTPVAEKPVEKPAAEKKPEKVAMAEPTPEKKPAPAPAPPPEPAAPPTLNVKWPQAPVPLTYTVRGKVSPGSSVTVNNVSAAVRKSGTFSAKIELPAGESVIEVKATGADGQVVEQKNSITAVEPPAKPKAEASDETTPKPAKSKPAGNAAKPQVKQEAAGWE